MMGEDDKADRGRGGKTTSGYGQAWSSASPRGQWRTIIIIIHGAQCAHRKMQNELPIKTKRETEHTITTIH